jgi:nucleotide-binding universal stress UspA family protein
VTPGGGDTTFDRVVVAVGAEDLARQVLPTALRVAAAHGVPLELVSVVARGSDDLPERRRELLEELAAEYSIEEPEITVLTSWSVAEAIVAHLDTLPPALLCVATSVRSRADDLLIGSTVGGILHRATSPVLVLGHLADGDADVLGGPVVVCADGSAESESIVPLARTWVDRSGQQPWVVTQIDPDSPLDPTLEQRGAAHLARLLGHGAEWEALRGTDPGAHIATFAAEREASLIIMATHGRSALGRAALGSTAMRVVERATCPVLVQRPASLPPEPPDEADQAGS